MSDEEGVTTFEAVHDTAPVRVAPAAGEGALDIWRPSARSGIRTQCRNSADPRGGDELASKPRLAGVDVRQHLSLATVGQTCEGKPRSEPDSGNPTVRDRRGALGNVATAEL